MYILTCFSAQAIYLGFQGMILDGSSHDSMGKIPEMITVIV